MGVPVAGPQVNGLRRKLPTRCDPVISSLLMDGTLEDLSNRFAGAILGAAVADALALPYRHYSRSFLRSIAGPLTRDFAEPTGFRHPHGQYSDDTQEALAVTASIVETGDVSAEAIAHHLIPLARDHLLIDRDPGTAEALARLSTSDGSQSGNPPGFAEIAPASRALPIAIWRHRDKEALEADVVLSTRITHCDSRSIASALAFAAAVASNLQTEELILGVFIDRVAGAASKYDPILAEAITDFPRTLSLSESRALRLFETLAPDDRYLPSQDGLGMYSIPSILVAMYYFLRAPYRYERVVESCLRVGGEINTPAFLAGGMSGALLGESEIPSSLGCGIVDSQEIRRACRDLFEAFVRRNPT